MSLFSNRKELAQCKKEYADEWDDDEIYCVADELRTEFPNLIFEKKTFCSGILILAGKNFVLYETIGLEGK